MNASGAKEGKITTTSKQADNVLETATLGGARGTGVGAVADHSLRGAGIGGAIGAAGGAVIGLLMRGPARGHDSRYYPDRSTPARRRFEAAKSTPASETGSLTTHM